MSIHLTNALQAVERFGREERVLLPAEPTADMIAAARNVAKLDGGKIRKLYAAMLDAYRDDD